MSSFSVSLRARSPINISLDRWLSQYDKYLADEDTIDSVFGFAEHSPMYGGRIWSGPELLYKEYQTLKDVGIGFRIPFTSTIVDREKYEASYDLLSTYHEEGNSIITVSDELAIWVKEDFPKYKLEASVIKNAKDGAIDELLDIYDTIVLPMSLNLDIPTLESIQDKDRVRLFMNAGCALHCKSKICYPTISKINARIPGSKFLCSKDITPRAHDGLTKFDVQVYKDLGFSKFKLVTDIQGNAY